MTNNTPDINWETVVPSAGNDAESAQTAESATQRVSYAPVASAAAAAPPNNLPPFPQGVSYMIGRLPIKVDTAVAIVQLPEPIKGVNCATVVVNSGVLSDCYRDSSKVCVPTALRGQPINDREIKVVLDGAGDGKVVGPGWTAGDYPGSMPKTRSIEVGVPYVEVVLFVGVDCGCNSEKWAPDTPEWG